MQDLCLMRCCNHQYVLPACLSYTTTIYRYRG